MTRAIAVAAAHPGQEWDHVGGPAGAVVASANRLGWTMVSATEFATHRGRHTWPSITMGELRLLVEESYERWRWESARSSLPGDAPDEPPLLGPLRSLARSMPPREEGLLAMLVEGGAWTQAALYARRHVASADCLLCGDIGNH